MSGYLGQPNRLAALLANTDPIYALPPVPLRYGQQMTMPDPNVVQGVPVTTDWYAMMRRQPLTTEQGNAHGNMLANLLLGFAGSASPGRRYVRRSQTAASPFNDRSAGMAMFLETRDPRGAFDQLSGYGPAAWVTRGEGAVPVQDVQPAMVRALRSAGHHEQFGTTAAQLAREANPRSIVDSAGLWDNPQLVRTIWDDVLQPRGINAVRTNDGLLIFDGYPGSIRRLNGVP